MRALPSPPRTILGTGQPKFRSIPSQRDASPRTDAASAITPGSDPKICTATGLSSFPVSARRRLFLSPNCSALAEIISVQKKSTPKGTQLSRKALSPAPAMGAR